MSVMTREIASSPGSVSSSTILPSARKSTRSALAATLGSWVTTTTVCPSSSTAERRIPKTSFEAVSYTHL